MLCNKSYIMCKPRSSSPTSYSPSCSGGLCICPMDELVKNGGFEENRLQFQSADIDLVPSYWTIDSEILMNVSPEIEFAYEGITEITFSTISTADEINKHARLFQNVTVTPGCLLQLSFAERFFSTGANFELANFTARVYYGDPSSSSPNQVELINIYREFLDSSYVSDDYTFHQKVATVPVPCNISNVTVEFIFNARDLAELIKTSWLLDGVSLRAVSPVCYC